MSNACKNSLLIIVAVIVCVATPLVGSKVFAQSELFFPVARSVSYTAPSLETVFENTPAPTTVVQHVSLTIPDAEVVFVGHPHTTVAAKESSQVVRNLPTSSEAVVYVAEVPASETFMVRSELRFPVTSKVHYSAPDLETVFSGYPSTSDAVVTKVTSYLTPDLEVVFVGHPVDTTRVVTAVQTDKRHATRKQDTIMRNIADLQRQVAVLQQQIAALTGNTTDDFGCDSCGPTVKNLQQFLNRNGFTLATIGAGSPGQETSYFGPRTLAALERFQSAYHIPVTGVVDAQTRNLINSITPNALGKITVTDCVTPKNTVATGSNSDAGNNGEIIRNDQDGKDGGESTSGNFFTNLFKKIANFFKNLFRLQ
ncbi:MAG: peptidoglycan-binding domain-containing protein [Candidatus Kaiserbacteria bacterium]|nr:peptidoglycan-binding domain-containing protein [Candidatus Kaiserbacteria bacterium]